jgi:hypothetical protein
MVKSGRSFIEDELNLRSGLLDGVLNELRPPGFTVLLVNPRLPRHVQTSPDLLGVTPGLWVSDPHSLVPMLSVHGDVEVRLSVALF